jgi:hypothetical protein
MEVIDARIRQDRGDVLHPLARPKDGRKLKVLLIGGGSNGPYASPNA